MSEEIVDNQDIDLSTVNLARPLLGRQALRCRIGNARMVKAEGRPRKLVVPLTLEEPGNDTNGRQVGVGFAVTDDLLLDPTGGMTQEIINEKIARLKCASLKISTADWEKMTPDQRKFSVADIIGKEVVVTFDTEPDKQDSSKIYQRVKRYNAVK